jgi:hypothetical protein
LKPRKCASIIALTRELINDELSNVSLAAIWPHIERAIVALNDSDPRRRSDAADQVLDAILCTAGNTQRQAPAIPIRLSDNADRFVSAMP